jgi:hypothetical protein
LPIATYDGATSTVALFFHEVILDAMYDDTPAAGDTVLGRGAEAALRTMKPCAAHDALICALCKYNIAEAPSPR